MQHPEIAAPFAPADHEKDAAKVPFFARKADRPALTVRSGVRAGASEEKAKRG